MTLVSSKSTFIWQWCHLFWFFCLLPSPAAACTESCCPIRNAKGYWIPLGINFDASVQDLRHQQQVLTLVQVAALPVRAPRSVTTSHVEPESVGQASSASMTIEAPSGLVPPGEAAPNYLVNLALAQVAGSVPAAGVTPIAGTSNHSALSALAHRLAELSLLSVGLNESSKFAKAIEAHAIAKESGWILPTERDSVGRPAKRKPVVRHADHRTEKAPSSATSAMLDTMQSAAVALVDAADAIFEVGEAMLRDFPNVVAFIMVTTMLLCTIAGPGRKSVP